MIVQIFKRIYQSTICSPILSIFVLFVYSILGGFIFRACELDHSSKIHFETWRRRNETFTNFIETFSQLADRMQVERPKFVVYKQAILDSFTQLAKKLDCLQDSPTNITADDSNWSLAGSIFYAGTLYTTIGYGSYAPQTTSGRIATMIYSLIGIPLVITVLNDMGKLLLGLLRIVSSKICNRTFRFGYKLKNKFGFGRKFREIGKTPVLTESNGDEDIPISGALVTFVVWMSGCAGAFMLLETKWNFFEAFYFAFISLTTIGLGDFTPSSPIKAALSIPLLLMGLSVISLCINVIQANVGRIFNEFVNAINREYQKKQLGGSSLMQSDVTTTGATGVKSLMNNFSLRQRLLFKLLDKQKLTILEEKFEQQAKMRNQHSQTCRQQLNSVAIQVSDEDEIVAELEKNMAKPVVLERNSEGRHKSYIYNIDD